MLAVIFYLQYIKNAILACSDSLLFVGNPHIRLYYFQVAMHQ